MIIIKNQNFKIYIITVQCSCCNQVNLANQPNLILTFKFTEYTEFSWVYIWLYILHFC